MAFKYRLDTLLRLKKLNESKSKERLFHAQAALATCEELIESLEENQDELTLILLEENDECLSATEYALVAQQLAKLSDSLQQAEGKRRALGEEHLQCVDDTSKKTSERKAYEELKSRALARFLKESKKREQAAMDATGTRIYFQFATPEYCDE